MNIQTDITPDRDVVLTVEIPAEEPTAKLLEAFQLFQRRANIPGFRPGKAPMDMIKKRYGKDIIGETIDDLTRDALNKALDSEKLEPAGKILIDHQEFGENKPLRFTARFPLRPEPKLAVHKGLNLTITDADVSDADVDGQIEALRHRHAHLHSIDTPAPANAVLTLKVHEVHASGLELIGQKVEEKQIEIGADTLGAGSDEQLIGIKAGETRVIRVRSDASGVTSAPTSVTIITPQEAAQQAGRDAFTSLSVEAVRVEVPHIHDLDEEFVGHVNPALKSVDDLKKYTRMMLLSYVAMGAQRQLEAAIVQQMVEQNPFPVPKMIVEGTLADIALEMKLKGEEFDHFITEHYAEAERDYRWVLLRDEVATAENIEISDEEFEQELQRMAEMSGETIAAVKMRYSGEDKMDRLRGRLFEQRVLQFIAENAEIERRKMDLREFLRMVDG